MNIEKNLNGKSLTLSVAGRIDTMTSPALEAEITSSIGDINELVFDFAKVDYISSSGLRVLLSTQKAMKNKGSMKLKNVNEVVMEILDVTGFSDILDIE